MADVLTDPVMHLYATCAAVLVLKMWLTGTGTGVLRVAKGVYITQEDYAVFGQAPAQAPDATIERVRRAHQNDLENILPFLAIGWLYAATRPPYDTAWWLYVGFTAARVAHTLVYVAGLQPWRTLIFEAGNIALLVMIVMSLMRIVG